MKIQRIFRKSRILLIIAGFTCLTFFSGCIFEDLDGCAEYNLDIVVKDVYGSVLSLKTLDSLTIYLFNQEGYIRMIKAAVKGQDIRIGYERDDQLTLIAWGNLKNDSLVAPALTKGMSLEDGIVRLRETGSCNLLPTDLFYSLQTYSESDTSSSVSSGVTMRSNNVGSDTLLLIMNRTIAHVKLTAKNMSECFGTDTAGYHFVVQGLHDALSFYGEPLGDTARYIPASYWIADDVLYAPVFRILPVLEDSVDDFQSLSLYRGNTKLFTTHTDSKGQLLRVKAGEQMNVTIDFHYAQAYITVTISPWDETTQETEL